MAVGKLANLTQANPAQNGDIFLIERGGTQYGILYQNLPFSGGGGGGSGLAYAITGISVTGGNSLTGLFNLYPLGGVQIITSGDKTFISGAGIDSSNVVYTTGDQSIDGIKTFLTRPQFYSGAEIFFNSGNVPGVRISGMFNGTGQRYTGLFVDIFDSGKVSGSMLAEFRVNGETRASISNSGLATFSGVFTTGPVVLRSPHAMLQEYGQFGIQLVPEYSSSAFKVSRNDAPTNTYCYFGYFGGYRVGYSTTSNGIYGWTDNSVNASLGVASTLLLRDSSGIVSLRGNNPFTQAALRVYQVTGGGSGEFALFGWQNSGLVIGPFAFNSGILRDVRFTGANLWFVPTGTINFNSRPFANGSGVAFTGELLGYATITSLELTGQALYQFYTGLSGALSQTGVSLISLIQDTGSQAWNAANNNGINLSGNLASTGATLEARITGYSGFANNIYYPRTNPSGYLSSLSGLSTGYVTGASGTLAQSIFQTGSNLQGQIDTINSRPYVTGINVTGAPTLTGLIRFEQRGNVNIKQSGDLIVVSGAGMSGTVSVRYYAQSNGSSLSDGDIYEATNPSTQPYGTIVDNDLVARNMSTSWGAHYLTAGPVEYLATSVGKLYVSSNHNNPLDRQLLIQTGYGSANDGKQMMIHFTGTGAMMISKTGANMDLKYDWVPNSGEIIAFRFNYPELRWKEQWRNPDTGYFYGTGTLPANPTATVGLSATNGSATTFMRSDAAPALDQGIAPTWTSPHRFNSSINLGMTSTNFIIGNNSVNMPAAASFIRIGSNTLTGANFTLGTGYANGHLAVLQIFNTGYVFLQKNSVNANGTKHALIEDWNATSGDTLTLIYDSQLNQWNEVARKYVTGYSGVTAGQTITSTLVTGSGIEGYIPMFTAAPTGIINSKIYQHPTDDRINVSSELVGATTRYYNTYSVPTTGEVTVIFSRLVDAYKISAQNLVTENTTIKISTAVNAIDGEQKLLFWQTGQARIPATGEKQVLLQDWVPSSGHILKLTLSNGAWREEYRWPPVTGSGTVGGGGEANTASNLGNGVGLFSSKAGVDLPFYSISGGTGIEIKRIGNEVRVDSTVNTGLFYLASNPSGYLNTLSGLSTGYVTGVSGTLVDRILSYSGFVNGFYYPRTNPSGYLASLSGLSTGYVTGVSGTLVDRILSYSGFVNGFYYPRTNPSGYLSSLSGLSTGYVTGVSGTLVDRINSRTINDKLVTGSGIVNVFPIFSDTFSGIRNSVLSQYPTYLYCGSQIWSPTVRVFGTLGYGSTGNFQITTIADGITLSMLDSGAGNTTFEFTNGTIEGQQKIIYFQSGQGTFLRTGTNHILTDNWVPNTGGLLKIGWIDSKWREEYRWPPITGTGSVGGGQTISDKLITGSGFAGYIPMFTVTQSGIQASSMVQTSNARVVSSAEFVGATTRFFASLTNLGTGYNQSLTFSTTVDAYKISAQNAGTGNTRFDYVIPGDYQGEQKYLFWETGQAHIPRTGLYHVLTQDWIPVSGDILKLCYVNSMWREEYRWPQITGTSAAGAGEANTASNLGNGVGLFSSKVGVDLPFYSISGGTGIEIKRIGNEVKVDANFDIYAANNNATNLSGNLTQTGVDLIARIDANVITSRLITGSGTTGYVPLFTSDSGIINSALYRASNGIYTLNAVFSPYYIAVGASRSTSSGPNTNLTPSRGYTEYSSHNTGPYTDHRINLLGAQTGQSFIMKWNTGNAYIGNSSTVIVDYTEWIPSSGDIIKFIYDGAVWREKFRYPASKFYQKPLYQESTTIFASFTGFPTQMYNLTGSNAFTLTGIGYNPHKEIKLLLSTTGMVSPLIYPTGWVWIGQVPTGIPTGGKHAVLSLISTNTDDNGVWAAWNTEP